MELRRTETTGADLFGRATKAKRGAKTRRRRSTAGIRDEKATDQASLQWVTARLPAALVREIDALAKRAGVTRSDSIRDCLGIGIETIRGRDGVPSGRIDELLEALQGIRAAVDLVGPPTYGVLRLLAHWATRDRALKVAKTSCSPRSEPAAPTNGSRLSQKPKATCRRFRKPGRQRRNTDVFFVEARYHRSPDRAAGQVRYIAHREEGLTDGRSRELYGIGGRYRSLRGDEPSIRRALREDARGLRSPVYFRFILTVDNPTAARFARLDGQISARVLRDAIDKTFRGALRGAQGVFAVHEHGGMNRPAHPHVHALLSPRFENGMAVHIAPAMIQRVKERWEREVLAGLQRQERRLDRMRFGIERAPEPRARTRDDRVPLELLARRSPPRRGDQLDLFARAKKAVSLAHSSGLARQWLRFGRGGTGWERDPERVARLAVFRLASRAMPQPIRDALWLLRGVRDTGLRQR